MNEHAQVLIGGLLSLTSHRRSVAQLEENETIEDEVSPPLFLEKMGHYKYFDDVSLHPYAFKGFGATPHAPHNKKDVERVTRRVYNNIQNVRGELTSLGSVTEEMPIWITEIGWPVKTKNNGEHNDEVHWPIDEAIQRDLLNATFEMMKGESF